MFTPTLGKWSNLTNIFQRGWFNHQLECRVFLGRWLSRSAEQVGWWSQRAKIIDRKHEFWASNFGSFLEGKWVFQGSLGWWNLIIWPEKSLETWDWGCFCEWSSWWFRWIWIFFGGDMFWYIHRRCPMFSILPFTIFLNIRSWDFWNRLLLGPSISPNIPKLKLYSLWKINMVHLKITSLKNRFIFQTFIFGFHVRSVSTFQISINRLKDWVMLNLPTNKSTTTILFVTEKTQRVGSLRICIKKSNQKKNVPKRLFSLTSNLPCETTKPLLAPLLTFNRLLQSN